MACACGCCWTTSTRQGRIRALAALDAHPNVEVRLFNPFANRGMRMFEFATDFRRVDRRMHNKSMTADNQLTVVGGRNIGDAYFAAKSDVDFSDLDLLAGGPVVPQVSAVFDDYWNAEATYPLATVAKARSDAETVAFQQRVRQYLDDRKVKLRATPYGKTVLDSGVIRAIQQGGAARLLGPRHGDRRPRRQGHAAARGQFHPRDSGPYQGAGRRAARPHPGLPRTSCLAMPAWTG